MNQRVKKIAPKLSPLIIPKQFTISEKIKDEIFEKIKTKSKKSKTNFKCFYCEKKENIEEEFNELKIQLIFEIDWKKSQYKFIEPRFVCEKCSQLLDLNGFILRSFSSLERNSTEIENLIEHFFQVNSIDQNLNQNDLLTLFQECYSLSFSLFILSSANPSLIFVSKEGEKIENSEKLIELSLNNENLNEKKEFETKKKVNPKNKRRKRNFNQKK
ncbi:hypothetical protein M0811_09368 [Anaeramoeba ignava]|uniref:Uncharacterized protein n=1 Tax=Anaeramoeba ignava TaxID=1746090 RepID=A0A9Q0RA65_ANAIG|nr:hypothetical protein M0811_09368 [Anaeramoeba ignava]